MKRSFGDSKGKIIRENGKASIEFERFLSHPPETIWNAITDKEQLSAWYICKVRIEQGIGGNIEFWFGPNYHVTGLIRVWQPPYVLEHEWNIEPTESLADGVKSTVRWELVKHGEGTLIRLTHRNLSDDVVNGMIPWLDPAPADHLVLDSLDAYLSSIPLPEVQEGMFTLIGEYRKLRGGM